MGYKPPMGDLVTEISDFLDRHEGSVSKSMIGVQAVGDGHFVFDLLEGRKPRAGLVERVRRWMRAYDAAKAAQ